MDTTEQIALIDTSANTPLGGINPLCLFLDSRDHTKKDCQKQA